MGLERVLYRSIQRLAKRVDTSVLPHQQPVIAQCVDTFLRTYRERGSEPAGAGAAGAGAAAPPCDLRGRVRRAFSSDHGGWQTSSGAPVDSVDVAFAALRDLPFALDILLDNRRLATAAVSGASYEDGAVIIADMLTRTAGVIQDGHASSTSSTSSSSSSSSCAASVSAELDALADAARRELAKGSRLRPRLAVVQAINRALYGHGALPIGAPPPSDVFIGDFEERVGDVATRSHLAEVLRRKRALPITLSVVYHAVAARLGLDIRLTNFPNHVLLRLDARRCDDTHPPTTTTAATAVGDMVHHDGGSEGGLGGLGGGGGGGGGEGLVAWGVFAAEYGPHGMELIEVTVRTEEEQEDGGNDGWCVLTATKITGDIFVPAGEVSFTARLRRSQIVEAPTSGSSRGGLLGSEKEEDDEGTTRCVLREGCTVAAEVQVAHSGFREAHFKPCELAVVSGEGADGGGDQGGGAPRLVLRAEGDVMAFFPARDDDLFFVDAFNGGKVFTEGSVRAYLAESFGIGHPDEHPAQPLVNVASSSRSSKSNPPLEEDGDPQAVWLASVEPAAVWARMTRNLALFFTHRQAEAERQQQRPQPSSSSSSSNSALLLGSNALRWTLVGYGLDALAASEHERKQ